MTAASPGPAPVTPGQAAYEAFYAGTECGAPVPWAELTDWNEHWNAAAQAAIDADRIGRKLATAHTALERIAAAPATAEAGRQRDEARAVVAEMLSVLREYGVSDELLAQWRQRAGLDGACSVCVETGSPHGVPQPAPELPKTLGHPDDAAEEWLAETYEPDDANAVGYDRSDMIDAFHSGSDWARRQIAKFGQDANGRWRVLEPQPAPGKPDFPDRGAAENAL